MTARVSGGGTVYIFTPLDDEAREWVDENVSDERQGWGDGFAVEHGYVRGLVSGFIEAGGEVVS